MVRGRLGALAGAVLGAGAALIVIALLRLDGGSVPQSTSAAPGTGTASAEDACRLPASDPKAGGPLTWKLVVRMDSPLQSDLVFVSGWARLVCTADRRPDGTFGSAATSMGGDPAAPFTGDILTYETGREPAVGAQYPTRQVVGRMPAATARVEVVTSDGQRRDAVLGDGWYLADVAATSGSVVTEIDAVNAAGKVISKLASPAGIGPGASAAAP
jgi:hypothetical protein